MLKLVNISKSFPGQFSSVFKSFSLEIQQGDFCILMGSNGSGKSTLLKIISGEYQQDSGEIYLGDENISFKNRNILTEHITQDVNKSIVQEMTLLENIVLSKSKNSASELTLYKSYKKEVLDQISELKIGLDKFIDIPISALSGGQKQLISTFMAFQNNPKLLLLDEHTSALDPKIQNYLMELTSAKIRANKITSIMVTHKLDDAIKYGNRLIMLSKGRVALDLNNREKSKLSANDLLDLFHEIEDKEFKEELSYVN